MTPAEQVRKLYNENLAKGMTQKDAAKDAQKNTGVALRTGQSFKRSHRSLRQMGKVTGQYE